MYKFRGTGLTSAERKRAQRKFSTYKNNYSIQKESELVLVEELVFQEVLIDRYKAVLEKIAKSKEIKDQVPPAHIKKSIDECLTQSILLKEKLELFDKKEDKNDAWAALHLLFKKFKIWCDNHWDERKTICPKCGFVYFLRFRVEKYTPLESPFFKNRILANKPLFDLWEKGKITAKEAADVLGTSEDYVIEKMCELYKKSNNKDD
jgi:hypothetical protein